MTSRMALKEMEIVKLKEDNKKMARHFIQKKTDDQVPPSLLKVCTYVAKRMYVCMYLLVYFNRNACKGKVYK